MILIARAFGTSDQLDAYLLAFLVPSFVGEVVAGASSPALIPMLLEAHRREGVERANRLQAGFLLATLAGSLSLAALLAVFAPALVRVAGSGFADEKLALTRHLLGVMAPIVVFGGMGSVWRAALNAAGEFAAPAVTFAITPAVTIAFLLAGKSGGNAWLLAYGTVAGAALECAAVASFAWRRSIPLLPAWHGWDPMLARAASQYWPVFASSIILGASIYVQQSIAASLGPGSVSALNYGSRLPALLLSLGPAALGAAVLPPFSELAAQGHEVLLRATLARSLRVVLWVSISVTVVAILISAPAVRLILQHGQFSTLDTQLVARLQQLYLLQIPLALPAVVLARLFSTLQAARVLLAASAISLAANVVLGIVLAHNFGLEGLALAAGAGSLFHLAFLAFMLNRTKFTRV